jgi:excisionase family DNA binding protein
MNEDEYDTIPELAGDHKVSPKTLYRAIKRGDLKATKFGRAIRIWKPDRLAYEHQCRRDNQT